jgi:diaminopimelate epimerase
MRFTKMHGIGNDYIYLDAIAEPDLEQLDLPDLARRISHRHTGIGADGLILVCKPEPGTRAHVRMRMFNADGSESEMCGNGVRCVAKLAHDRGHVTDNPMLVQTGRGVLVIGYDTADGRLVSASVDMGEPILDPAAIPADFPGEAVIDFPLSDSFFAQMGAGLETAPQRLLPGVERALTCVSMGNPHAILFCDDPCAVPLERIGPAFEHHPAFPRRVNLHLVRVHTPGEVTMRTWERGSGITMACGTGAAAVCVAGALTRRTARRILAHLPGGDLKLEWRDDNHVVKAGPAVEICTGDYHA